VSCANTAEPVEMLFQLLAPIGPRNHVLDEVQIPMGKGNFEGKRAAYCRV